MAPTRATPAPPGLSAREVAAVRRAVQAWFAEAGRPLPWREHYDPYAVWVSEIMLQQTQVETVLPYYARWMERLPNVRAVAGAPEEVVLKLWEGLGYYSRARNLRRAAQAVVERHDGRIPTELDALLALPGVGRYTAGAIASIGHDRRAPLVDGNVARVLGRLVALEVPARSTAGQATLWALAEALCPAPAPPADSPRQFNQGLMELGALVCRQRSPQCLLCPVRAHCRAFATGDPARFPPPTPRRPRPVRSGAMLFAARGGRWLVRKRPSRGVWGGLWEFPWVEAAPEEDAQAAARRLLAELGAAGSELRPAGDLRHGLTHFELTLSCYAVDWPAEGRDPAAEAPAATPLRWVSRAGLAELPLARLCHKALALLDAE